MKPALHFNARSNNGSDILIPKIPTRDQQKKKKKERQIVVTRDATRQTEKEGSTHEPFSRGGRLL